MTAAERTPITLDDLRTRATIRVEEAAEILGISRGSAYEAARTGDLPVLRIGHRLLVPAANLLRLLGIEDLPPASSSAVSGVGRDGEP